MLLIHPLLQGAAILLAVYTFFLGAGRFQQVHLHRTTYFNWKRHVLCGKIALFSLLVGFLGATLLIYHYWHTFLLTGLHGKTAWILLPFILSGLGSGLYMDRVKRKRRLLNFIHGSINTIVLLVSFFQIYTGWKVFTLFVLPGLR